MKTMNKTDRFAADLPRLDQELRDRQDAERMAAIVAGLVRDDPDGLAQAKAALAEVAAQQPGGLPVMLARIEKARLRRAGALVIH
jgi:hypothetical protein